MPLGAINNKRSFVALDNFVDFIVTCITHQAAANQTFLVSDGEDISTTDLLTRLARVLNVPIRLFSVHPSLLIFAASVINRKDIVQRVCGSLQVDIGKSRKILNWVPPISVNIGLQKTAEHFLKNLS